MPRNPFKPPTSRKEIVSNHPKTISNQRINKAKRGLELAIHRDTLAFRTAKSRKLKALHGSKQWSQLSASQKAEAEEDCLAELRVKLEQKKEAHEMEWKRRVENGEDSETDTDSVATDYDVMERDNDEELKGGSDEWTTDSEELNEVEGEANSHSSALAKKFLEIRDEAGKEWLKKMKMFEADAEESAKKWKTYVQSTN